MQQQSDFNLWPVRIRVVQLNLGEEMNRELANTVKKYSDNHMAHYESGFKHNITHNVYTHEKAEVAEAWLRIVQEQLELYLFEVAGLTPGDYTKPSFNAFGSSEKRGQWSPPHSHQGNQVVLTYYPEVIRDPAEPHPYAGSLFFHNPTPTQSGFWARKELAFTPVKVETGTLVIFPGNAMHSTSPFFCEGSSKCAMVTNVRFAGTLEGDDPRRTYCTDSEIEEAREELRNQK